MTNFINFASTYKPANKKLVSQPRNVIPRVFPVYSSNLNSPNFGLYCKYQLLTYKPWQNNQDNAWGDQPGSDEAYITSCKAIPAMDYPKKHVPDWFEKLQSFKVYQRMVPILTTL